MWSMKAPSEDLKVDLIGFLNVEVASEPLGIFTSHHLGEDNVFA